ncbi:response regulator [Nostoc sp. CHAB 5844]|nr:response regulator [Nostoc sp. CHAB 5844]
MSPKTILLMNDESHIREIIELCLTDLAGWNVITADSLLEALQKAKIEHPDAIFMDLSMHCIDSLKLINKLRKNPQTQAIPIVMLSYQTQRINPQFLEHYQIAGIIPKPFNILMLPVQIAKMLCWSSR